MGSSGDERCRRPEAPGFRSRPVVTERSTLAAVSDGPVPQLLFSPAADRWFVDNGGQWFEPSSERDLDDLLGLLRVRVVDGPVPGGRPSGLVRVVDGDGDATLEFLRPFGEKLRRGMNRIPALMDAKAAWETGAHDDGWIETHAVLRLDGVRRCWLHAYLPEAADNSVKELAVQSPDGRRARVDIHRLERGEPVRLEVFRSRRAAKGVRLILQASYAELADDERHLGFMATRLEALA